MKKPNEESEKIRNVYSIMEAGDFRNCMDYITELDETTQASHPVKLALINCLIGIGDLGKSESLLNNYDSEENEERKIYLLLKIYYLSNRKNEFIALLKSIRDDMPESPFISSISWHASIKWRIDDVYNFCQNPLHYVKCIQVQNTHLKKFKSIINKGDIFLNKGYLKKASGFELPSNENLEQIIRELIGFYVDHYSSNTNAFLSSLSKAKKIEFWKISTLEGGKIRPHIHSGVLSGIIFCNANENFGDTVFTEQCPELTNDSPTTFRSMKITPKKGLAVLFPASVSHFVETNNSDSSRITIPFNAYV